MQIVRNIIKSNGFIRFFLSPFIKIWKKQKKHVYEKEIKCLNDAFEKIFSRVLSRTIIVDLKEYLGVFELDIRSDIFRRISLQGYYESNILETISKYLNTSKDAIDCGANVGFYSIYFANILKEGHKVLSIEPTPNAFELLKNNVLSNNCEKQIILYNGALSDKINEEMVINTIEGREEYSSFGEISQSYIRNSEVHKIKVQATTLDFLVNQYNIHPGFIKIDTEGAELLVLKGAIKTIQNFRPIIISEICDDFLKRMNHSSNEIFDLLEENNYKIMNSKSLNKNINFPFSGEIIAIPN